MAVITTKKFNCSKCGYETSMATNHEGNTWSWGRVNCCPKCPPYDKYPEFAGSTTWVIQTKKEENNEVV